MAVGRLIELPTQSNEGAGAAESGPSSGVQPLVSLNRRRTGPPALLSWYALHVRHQCEPLVVTALRGRAETFWPHASRKTSNRHTRRYPWFPGYLFVRADWDLPIQRAHVLSASHLLGVLGGSEGPLSIPDQEIEHLQILAEHKASVMLHPYVATGDRVRVTKGPFSGVEGILVRFGSSNMLVVQIEVLGRGVGVSLPDAYIESLARVPRKERAA